MENDQIKKQTTIEFAFPPDKFGLSGQFIQLLGSEKRING
jgi:hypothetical protein